MLRALVTTDRWIALSRPAWLWAGQLGIVLLGIHLAADRLDDGLHSALTTLGVELWRADAPARIALWCGVCVELIAALRAATVLLTSVGGPEPSRREWWEKRSVEAFARPVFWAMTAAAGAWSVGMAVEDALAPWLPQVAPWAGGAAALLVAWRLGWTGFQRVVGGLFAPRTRLEGLGWAPLLLLVAALAAIHGLPFWGALS